MHGGIDALLGAARLPGVEEGYPWDRCPGALADRGFDYGRKPAIFNRRYRKLMEARERRACSRDCSEAKNSFGFGAAIDHRLNYQRCGGISSRHFRNQLRYLQEHFESFRDLFQQTWQGIRVSEFIAADARHEEELSLMLMDDGFVAEAANFGHGLQMWLQIIWFLARTSSDSVIVLDEPDVYMHPEQQASMVSLLRDRFCQCLLSTHSEQIIKTCDASELLRLHRNLRVSKHGVSQSEYDHEVDQPSKMMPRHVAKGVDAFILKVVLYGESKISIWDGAGELVASIKCSEEGATHKLTLTSDRYRVSLVAPQDVELYVDGECRSLIGYAGQKWAEFDLDLSE